MHEVSLCDDWSEEWFWASFPDLGWSICRLQSLLTSSLVCVLLSDLILLLLKFLDEFHSLEVLLSKQWTVWNRNEWWVWFGIINISIDALFLYVSVTLDSMFGVLLNDLLELPLLESPGSFSLVSVSLADEAVMSVFLVWLVPLLLSHDLFNVLVKLCLQL